MTLLAHLLDCIIGTDVTNEKKVLKYFNLNWDQNLITLQYVFKIHQTFES